MNTYLQNLIDAISRTKGPVQPQPLTQDRAAALEQSPSVMDDPMTALAKRAREAGDQGLGMGLGTIGVGADSKANRFGQLLGAANPAKDVGTAIALARFSPINALVKRLVRSGGNAVKGTAVEEAINFLARRELDTGQTVAGPGYRTLSHVTDVYPENMTDWTSQGPHRLTLGAFVPHEGGPLNNGQIGNIAFDPVVRHMDAADAIDTITHETTHGGQILRMYDALKRANVPPSEWKRIVEDAHRYGSEKIGYHQMPMEANARAAGTKKLIEYSRDVEMDPSAYMTNPEAGAFARARAGGSQDAEGDRMIDAVNKALANYARKTTVTPY